MNFVTTGQWTGRIHALSAGKWYTQLLPLDASWRLDGVLPKADVSSVALNPAQ
jgi:hypothetical protein